MITFSNNIILLATTIKHVLTDLRFRKIKRIQNPAPVCFQKQPPGSCLLSEAANFIKKETLAQVFSREFCEICKNTFFYRTPLVAASEICQILDFFFSFHFGELLFKQIMNQFFITRKNINTTMHIFINKWIKFVYTYYYCYK